MFSQLLKPTAAEAQSTPLDEFKAIDASHPKAHHPQSTDNPALGKTKGGGNTKLNACVNGAAKALELTLVPGNRHDVLFAIEVIGAVSGKVVLGDRGYDGDKPREHIFEAGGFPMIPPKSNRKNPVFIYQKSVVAAELWKTSSVGSKDTAASQPVTIGSPKRSCLS